MALTFTWLGQSGIALQMDDKTLLIDPFLTHNPLAPFGAETLAADAILITHGHGDHIGDTVSIAQRTGALVIGTPEITRWIKTQGITNTWEGNTGGTYYDDWFTAKFTMAFHTSSLPDGSYGGVANGFIVTIGGKRLYHAGDTGLFGDMRLIGDSRLDVALLPIGDKFTMGIDDSLLAIKMLNPRYVVPLHFNTFPGITQDVVDWARRVNNETNATPIVSDPGHANPL